MNVCIRDPMEDQWGCGPERRGVRRLGDGSMEELPFTVSHEGSAARERRRVCEVAGTAAAKE